MRYLLLTEILVLHDLVIEQSGGSAGVRDMELLESATARPQTTFGGEDLYPSVYMKAAVLLHSIASNHAFVDGNKRTALMASFAFLELNGVSVTKDNDEAVEFMVRVVEEKISVEKIAEWMEGGRKTGDRRQE